MTIKPRTYYKRYNRNDIHCYSIYYTGRKNVYTVAYTTRFSCLRKTRKKLKWGTIEHWQHDTDYFKHIVEEVSKEDVFLELL